jgi:phosphoglycolate phosphatase
MKGWSSLTLTVRVGIVTRNITREPEETLLQLLRRHDIDSSGLDFLSCLPLREEKLIQFRTIRMLFDINPARSYACGDEYRDYLAATGAGMHPFIASYGFEDHVLLRDGFNVPEDVLARTPQDLSERFCHALDIELPGL